MVRSRFVPGRTHSTLCSLSDLLHIHSPKSDFPSILSLTLPPTEQPFSTPRIKPGNHWFSCYFSFVIGQALKNTSHLIQTTANTWAIKAEKLLTAVIGQRDNSRNLLCSFIIANESHKMLSSFFKKSKKIKNNTYNLSKFTLNM